MNVDVHFGATSTRDSLLGGLGRKRLLMASALGVVGALLSGSLVLAIGPILALVIVHLLWNQPLEKLLTFAVGATLLLEHPAENPFMGRWRSPLAPLSELWSVPLARSVPGLPVPLAPAFLVTAWLLIRVLSSPRPRPAPAGRAYLRACAAAAVTLLLADFYGLARGGSLQQTFYQLAPMLATLAVGATACLLASPTLLRSLERVLMLAAGIRALMAVYVYLTVFRPAGESYLYVTTHSDSVLWVVAVALLIGRIIATFRLDPQRARVALLLLLLAAIAVNNRRLAWVELAVAAGYAMWAVPQRLYRLRKRIAVVAVPALLAYTAAGAAGPPSMVFAPVQALISVNDEEDSSTLSREIENHNLLVTIRQGGPLGIGFGHPYTEAVVGPNIATAFPQYRYLPHNSTLGLLAFAGIIGFIGFWLPFVVAMGSVVRLRDDPSRHVRAAGIWFGGAIIAYTLMAWGDIGLQSSVSGLLGGLAAGLATGLQRSAHRSEQPAELDSTILAIGRSE